MTMTNLGMTVPTTGASSDVWGDLLNADLALIDTFAGGLMGAAAVTVASASTCDIAGAACTAVIISGTTGISSLGTGTNRLRFVRFSGTSLLITRSASLETPTGADIQAASGDTCIVQFDGSSNARIVSYTRGAAVQSNTSAGANPTASLTQQATVTLSPGKWRLSGMIFESSGSAGVGQLVIGATTASSSGAVSGKSLVNYSVSSTGNGAAAIIGFDVTVTTSTPYYLNAASSASSPNVFVTLRADPII